MASHLFKILDKGWIQTHCPVYMHTQKHTQSEEFNQQCVNASSALLHEAAPDVQTVQQGKNVKTLPMMFPSLSSLEGDFGYVQYLALYAKYKDVSLCACVGVSSAVCWLQCQNGGVCQRPNTCSCPEGWMGRLCEERKYPIIKQQHRNCFTLVCASDFKLNKTDRWFIT